MVSQIVALPFGGRGDSGYGRKHGDEGLREFAYPHAITEKVRPTEPPTTTFDRLGGHGSLKPVSAGALLLPRSVAGPGLGQVQLRVDQRQAT
jgi:hypothetical protein